MFRTRVLTSLTFIALISLTSVAFAVPIPIEGTGTLGSFTGTFDYTPSDESSGVVDISLTNTSPAANGGFLTAFLFNIPDGADVTGALLSSSDLDFGLLGAPDFDNSESGSPFGTFDIGASTGSGFEGGGNPALGIGVGGSATFSFALTGTGLNELTALSFLEALSVPPGDGSGVQSFVVRFRGFNDEGSDKVPGVIVTGAPEPGSTLLLCLGVASLWGARRRARKA